MAYQLFALGFRVVVAIAVVTAVVVHLARHVDTGGAFQTWPVELIAAISQPGAAIGLIGLAACAWLVLFVSEALSAGGVWGSLADVIRGGDGGSRFFAAFNRALDGFPRALAVRLFTSVATITGRRPKRSESAPQIGAKRNWPSDWSA